MKRNAHITLCFILLTCCQLWAQDKAEVPSPTIPRADSLLYRAIFCDSIAFDADYFIAHQIYYHTYSYDASRLGATEEFDVEPIVPSPSGYSIARTFTQDGKAYYRLIFHTASKRGTSEIKTRQMIKIHAQQFYDKLHAEGYDREADKLRMKRFMKAFRAKATVLPTIYDYIDKEYKGNIDFFVDDLFEKSIFSSPKKLKRFTRAPSKKKLVRDPAILYAISKIQYEVLLQWAALQRGEEIEIK